MAARIVVVFQHSMVVPQLTVAGKVFLGHREARGRFILGLIMPVAFYGEGADLSRYLGILVRLAIGAGIGMVNGFLVVRGWFNGFIVTVGMTVLLAGIQLGVVKGQTIADLPGRSPIWARRTRDN